MGSLSLLQGIFPTQGSNPGLPHCGQVLYQLSYQEASSLYVAHERSPVLCSSSPWSPTPSQHLHCLRCHRKTQTGTIKCLADVLLSSIFFCSQEPFPYTLDTFIYGFPGGSAVKNPPANAGDAGDMVSIPGLGRSPGEGNGNPLHYSCLGNPKDRGAWWATIHGVAKTQTGLSFPALDTFKLYP